MLVDVLGHNELENCETCMKHSPSTNTLKILQQITISIGDFENAPKLVQINVVGEPLHPEFSSASGEYVLQDRLINNFPYWQHAELLYVIWYNNDDDRWLISINKDIGTFNFIFVGSAGKNNWPNEISFKGKSILLKCCKQVTWYVLEGVLKLVGIKL